MRERKYKSITNNPFHLQFFTTYTSNACVAQQQQHFLKRLKASVLVVKRLHYVSLLTLLLQFEMCAAALQSEKSPEAPGGINCHVSSIDQPSFQPSVDTLWQ